MVWGFVYMHKIKAGELRKKSERELMDMVIALKKEIFAIRMSGNNGVKSIKLLRRQVARVLTILHAVC